ncbi:hypothetical protein FRB90_000719 [Tulasnella sp. 427]|nr:hypothetical protein FRB90_000719 [Tulasnella sp. 427]
MPFLSRPKFVVQQAVPRFHCVICHNDLDATTFSTTQCAIVHEWEESAGVFDVTAPRDLARELFFSECCGDAVQVITTNEDDEDEGPTPWIETVYPRGEHCYRGPHVIDPHQAMSYYNGFTLVDCASLGCASHPGKGAKKLKEWRANSRNPQHQMWATWENQDCDLAERYIDYLPTGVSKGLPAIMGLPYTKSRVIRARDYIGMVLQQMGHALILMTFGRDELSHLGKTSPPEINSSPVFHKVPSELWVFVFTTLRDFKTSRPKFERAANVRPLLLTCHLFNQIATPLAYERVRLNGEPGGESGSLLAALLNDGLKRKSVHELYLLGWNSRKWSASNFAIMDRLVKQLHELRIVYRAWSPNLVRYLPTSPRPPRTGNNQFLTDITETSGLLPIPTLQEVALNYNAVAHWELYQTFKRIDTLWPIKKLHLGSVSPMVDFDPMICFDFVQHCPDLEELQIDGFPVYTIKMPALKRLRRFVGSPEAADFLPGRGPRPPEDTPTPPLHMGIASRRGHNGHGGKIQPRTRNVTNSKNE